MAAAAASAAVKPRGSKTGLATSGCIGQSSGQQQQHQQQQWQHQRVSGCRKRGLATPGRRGQSKDTQANLEPAERGFSEAASRDGQDPPWSRLHPGCKRYVAHHLYVARAAQRGYTPAAPMFGCSPLGTGRNLWGPFPSSCPVGQQLCLQRLVEIFSSFIEAMS